MARGFTYPALSLIAGGGLCDVPNPGLDAEEVWSYQAGIESAALRYLRVKFSVLPMT